MAELHLVVLPGDGVGPEVCEATLVVAEALARRFGHALRAETHSVGYAAWERCGTPLPDDTLRACTAAPAVLLGAVGHPDAAGLPAEHRPEAALLELRAELGCFANLRPARVDPGVADVSPLREEAAAGCDVLVVRELTGGLYYGEPRGLDESEGRAWNTMMYRADEVERVARVAFEAARGRRSRVTSVDKANVLEVSRLWRGVVERVGAEYPDVALEHMYVDRAALELVLRPARFDVLLTENLFGDVLSDLAGGLCGSLGLLGSASVGGRTGLFEPVHGSAPEIAGRGTANPTGALRSLALALEHAYGLSEEAAALEAAISSVLARGTRTRDVAAPDGPSVGTLDFARAVAEALP